MRVRPVDAQQQDHPAAAGFELLELLIRVVGAMLRCDQILIGIDDIGIGDDGGLSDDGTVVQFHPGG
ncbi:MAG TPA: hypothetical protein PLD59_15410, partial [Tepidisphaeraceae bacterium]|nr:hypothetical protein [Tepidisphaeraceae bacterium]